MKKKLAAPLLLGVLSLQLVACGNDCKYDGCDAETYKKGYCEVHYVIEYPEEAISEMLGF